MKRSVSKLLAKVGAPVFYGGIAVLVVLAGWFFFVRDSGASEEILTVVPGDFVQEVSVSGKVVAAQEVDLGFSQGGRVTRVYVTVGQRVSTGATLAEVENGDLRAAVSQREAALQNQEAKLAALKAGTRAEEVAVAQAKVDNDILGLIDEIKDAYSIADDAVRNTIDLFTSNPRVSPQLNFSTSDSSIKSSVEAKRLVMEGTLSSWQSSVLMLSAQSNLPSAVSEAQKNLSATTALLSEANAALNRAITNASVTQANIDSYISAVAAARSGVNAAISAITSANATLDASRKNLELKKAGATAEDIAAQEAQIRAAQADVASARAQLQKTIISAPFNGIVTVVDAKAGKIVSPNTPEISMISSGTYQIESFVPEVNVSLLQVADKARVTLDAYGEGTLFFASIVSIDPAETVRDGVSTYRAILQFAEADPRIKSGMTANIEIVTEEKINVIAVPQGIVFEKNARKYVMVKEGEMTVEREVTTGSVSSLGNIEILSGLREGDQVVLSGKN